LTHISVAHVVQPKIDPTCRLCMRFLRKVVYAP